MTNRLDVSGFMMNSDLKDYFPLLNEARKFLKLTGLNLKKKSNFVYHILSFLNSYCTLRIVHTAEVRNDQETEAIIIFKPDRIGHGTFIFPSTPDRQHPNLLNLLKKCHIPVGG